MIRSRRWTLLAGSIATLALLSVTTGYGLYIRSGLYRRWVASKASDFLAAPVEIGAVQPINLRSQGFRNVRVWLPGQDQTIFDCELAIWRLVDRSNCELELRNGCIEVRSRGWGKQQVGTLIDTAVAHDFYRVRLARVQLINMNLTWQHGPLRLSATRATGWIDLSGQIAKADITCTQLNDIRAAEPIRIKADFTPGDPPLIHQLSLTIPGISVEAFVPLAALRPDTQAANDSQPVERSAGTFTGQIIYRQRHAGDLAGQVELTGSLHGVDLGYVGRLTGQANLRGTVSGTLYRALIEDGSVRQLSARLTSRQVNLAGLCRALGLPPVDGIATIDLNEFRYADGHVETMRANAKINDLNLAAALKFLEAGIITGRIDADFQRINVVNDKLAELTGQIRALPPANGQATIDRAILEAALWQMFKIPMPPVLPKQIKYRALGARLLAADDHLHIKGITGPAQQFLLLADIGGVPMPLIPEPAMTFTWAQLCQQATPHAEQARLAMVDWLRRELNR